MIWPSSNSSLERISIIRTDPFCFIVSKSSSGVIVSSCLTIRALAADVFLPPVLFFGIGGKYSFCCDGAVELGMPFNDVDDSERP
jgi:hypothetical protein